MEAKKLNPQKFVKLLGVIGYDAKNNPKISVEQIK